mmetsp:Transcript_11074/g.41014  ORF Transcript_11074/g.41014 Transcript_11074/m.41014 type:complete len:202 (+) Transcript_11074:2431-3036(+)
MDMVRHARASIRLAFFNSPGGTTHKWPSVGNPAVAPLENGASLIPCCSNSAAVSVAGSFTSPRTRTTRPSGKPLSRRHPSIRTKSRFPTSSPALCVNRRILGAARSLGTAMTWFRFATRVLLNDPSSSSASTEETTATRSTQFARVIATTSPVGTVSSSASASSSFAPSSSSSSSPSSESRRRCTAPFLHHRAVGKSNTAT